MREQKEKKKGGIPLDMEKLLDFGDDEPPSIAVIATTIPDIDDDVEKSHKEEFFRMNDKELEENIAKKKRTLEILGPRLPDCGRKLKAGITQLEAEIKHRRLRRLEKDNDGCEKLTQSKGPYFTSSSDDLRQETPSSPPAFQSKFTTIFSKTLEEKTHSRAVNAFERELSLLGPCGRRCGRGKIIYNGKSSPKEQPTATPSLRPLPFQCPTNLSVDGNKRVHLNGRKNGGHCSIGFPRILEEKSSVSLSKRSKLSQVKSPNIVRPRNGKFVVVVDEEEPELSESIEPEDKVDECMKDSKIYYPSSDDPESIEICYSDMECLAPQSYLSSTIMNFYIRYLQQTNAPTDRARCDYHFFNTYFYNKLKEAVLKKNNIQESYFIKFRRWWKGVNIFHKAYILLPIHESLHWSLVIICMPDKEDESGPILLHLDSLGLHYSKAIFENIKSFLREEWKVLKGGEAPPDLPIPDRIWKNLPRRFDERTIPVPQQRNDYDCGLFVLYFMERFINGAPHRLKKKDLAMFGNKWFKPEEASNLRRKVRKLLVDEFRNATEQNCLKDHDPLSSVDPQGETFVQPTDC